MCTPNPGGQGTYGRYGRPFDSTPGEVIINNNGFQWKRALFTMETASSSFRSKAEQRWNDTNQCRTLKTWNTRTPPSAPLDWAFPGILRTGGKLKQLQGNIYVKKSEARQAGQINNLVLAIRDVPGVLARGCKSWQELFGLERAGWVLLPGFAKCRAVDYYKTE